MKGVTVAAQRPKFLTMKMKFFWIPATDSAAEEAELNRFLASSRVIHVERVFDPGPPSGWAVCVQHDPSRSSDRSEKHKSANRKIDYREVLDEETFRIFAALRTWRKTAAAEDGVPLYTVARGTTRACAWPQLTCREASRRLARSSKFRPWGTFCVLELMEATGSVAIGRDTRTCQPKIATGLYR